MRPRGARVPPADPSPASAARAAAGSGARPRPGAREHDGPGAAARAAAGSGARPGSSAPPPGPLGIYLHVPFCEAICSYCNFNRGLLRTDVKRRYLAALAREIESAGDGGRADSVFFGGGTPSVLDPGEVRALLARCRSSFALDPASEITLETNPETASRERLDGYRSAGVTRLSIGVQSFRDPELRRLGRAHTAARAIEAFETARAAGFDDVSIDLMAWLPEQSLGHWRETLDVLTGLGPDHVSFYLLELYPNAPLREDMARGGWAQAPDDAAAGMYLTALDRFEAAGYAQYEISNAARPGRRCRHNLKYWSDGAWVGFGCGAHSTRGGRRWRNVAETESYVARVADGASPVAHRQVLSIEERATDALFLGLRLTGGVDVPAVERRYGVAVWERWGAELTRCVEARLLEDDRERLRLTRAGRLLASEVMQVFV